MKIIGFAEGAWAGIPGIVSAPTIHRDLAARGHHAILAIGGEVIRGGESQLVPDVDSARQRTEGNGTFGIVCERAWTRRNLSPAMLGRFSRAVADSDFVVLHSLYPFPVLMGYLLARRHRKPYGIWLHGVLAPFQRTISVRKKWIYNNLIADRVLRNAAVVFFSAEGERDETRELRLSAPSVVIPDGFDPDEFSELPPRGRFRAKFLNGHEGPLVLFLARLHAKKGLDILIEAMGRVVAARPDARLAIVGPPDPPAFEKQVAAWIEEAGIAAHCVLPGTAGPAMRLEAFADADMYVLPSHAENFGFSVFEAMASGVPVVISNALNYAGEIENYGAGIVLPRDVHSFADAVLELIDDPGLRSTIGARGREFSRRYSRQETAAKLESAVASILQGEPFPANLNPATIPDLGSKTLECPTCESRWSRRSKSVNGLR